ncbi:MAG: precorrin-2 C(20)-methyltransferase, partial [Thermoplasmata archaeon]
MAASARGQGARAGRLVGVGVGPGDPELVTLKALRALREADRVVAPTLAVDAAGRAETITRQALPRLRIERLVFDMSRPTGSGRSQVAPAARLLEWLDDGDSVAFVTLGDPNIYSTFASVAAAVSDQRPAAEIATVPGVMAFQALASEAGTVLLDGTQALSLVTALDGAGALEEALSSPERAIV